jgi:hypothetical protein
MLKYSIEVQDATGTYTQVADPERRYADALTALEGLTGEGTYRVRFGRFVKTEKVVVEDKPQNTGQFAIGAKVKFGARGKVIWEVFMNVRPGFVHLNPAWGGGSNRYHVPVSKLVLATEAVAPKAA